MAKDIDLTQLMRAGRPKDFYVQICNDDRSHHIIIASFNNFDAALGEYRRLVKEQPQMRVVMRHCAHVYRNYIPARLHNSYDRSRE